MNVDRQTDRCFRIISALIVEILFERPTAARALHDQLGAALKEYENANVS